MELSRGTMKKLLALITFAVALYTALEHLALTMAALGFVWGVLTPFLVGGAVVVEQIFAWPGIGSLMITSIQSRDYPVIMGVTMLICGVVLAANLVLDLIYAALDPRIQFR